MTTLDDIAARDAKTGMASGSCTQRAADRRYLLGLVREAREALQQVWFDSDGADPAVIDDLLARLTEGSDRT